MNYLTSKVNGCAEAATDEPYYPVIVGRYYKPAIRKNLPPSHKSAIRNVMISSIGESPERDEQIRQTWKSVRG